jgi:hypothetical protein
MEERGERREEEEREENRGGKDGKWVKRLPQPSYHLVGFLKNGKKKKTYQFEFNFFSKPITKNPHTQEWLAHHAD